MSIIESPVPPQKADLPLADPLEAPNQVTVSPGAAASQPVAPVRLASLDALRGFAMFWILGGGFIGRALREVPGTPLTRVLGEQFEHVTWQGFHFYDLLFPLFVFVVGVSLVLSLPRRLAQEGRGATVWRVIRRAFVIYLLGLWYYGGLSHGLDQVRWVGVLQRIAIAYLCGSLLFLGLKARGLIVVTVLILLGYWALLALVPIPGVGAGNYAETLNLSDYLDRLYLPGKRWSGDHDPEGLLSTLPAIGTCLLGVLAGIWMKRPGPAASKALVLIAAGVALAALGWVWGWNFPIIKKIWTSSFVLVAGGCSVALLGLFSLVIDAARLRRWAIPFIWIGMNPILLYLIENLVSTGTIAGRLLGGGVAANAHFGNGAGAVLMALVAIGWTVGLAWFFHDRRIFLRV